MVFNPESGKSRRRAFWALLVVVIVILNVGLIYTLPLSKIKVIVFNHGNYDQVVVVYIDGSQKVSLHVDSQTGGVVGTWNVVQGSHYVAIDSSAYTPDGVYDGIYAFKVGPLSTKDTYWSI